MFVLADYSADDLSTLSGRIPLSALNLRNLSLWRSGCRLRHPFTLNSGCRRLLSSCVSSSNLRQNPPKIFQVKIARLTGGRRTIDRQADIFCQLTDRQCIFRPLNLSPRHFSYLLCDQETRLDFPILVSIFLFASSLSPAYEKHIFSLLQLVLLGTKFRKPFFRILKLKGIKSNGGEKRETSWEPFFPWFILSSFWEVSLLLFLNGKLTCDLFFERAGGQQSGKKAIHPCQNLCFHFSCSREKQKANVKEGLWKINLGAHQEVSCSV